jgi:L-fucose isomerase-like protein
MIKAGFVGFGEVNTPIDIIIRKCEAAKGALEEEGLSLVSVYPVTDDYEEKDIAKAVKALKAEEFDVLVLCIAGWIPTHAVIKVAEHFRHKPMVLWGLAGWVEGDRLVTTADQAGTTALRKTMADLGYTFKYVYDIVGKKTNSKKVAQFAAAAAAASRLRHSRVGMAGYRDMNLYGTLYDGPSLKRVVGTEIETFEMLDIWQRYEKISIDAKQEVIDNVISKWKFLKEAKKEGLHMAAGYYLAIKEMVKERGYEAISLKDVDGMKRLLGFPPAPIFMLLADCDGICTIPENDSLGNVTQLMVKYATGQCGAYLEFYEFMEDRVLAGVPDYVPAEIIDGDITVMPAAFGELSEGILNVSKVKPGELTLCRLTNIGDKYYMHMVKGQGITPRKWEEAGWTQPAPQLPGLEILMDNVEHFAENVMCQHYIISYGDNTEVIKNLCSILGIEVIQS